MLASDTLRASVALVTVLAIEGCSQGTGRRSEPSPVVFEDRLVVEENDDKSPLSVPAAQLPAPGECRLWRPGRPMREQARAGPCSRVEPDAPPESWILYRPAQDPRLIHVRVVDPDQAGRVIQVRVYDAARGTYLGSKQRR